jgi:DNA-directed RNA polymerase subunit F
MPEAMDHIKKSKNTADLIKFVKEFTKMNPKDAAELRKKLDDLDLMKLNSDQKAKIIELAPEDKEDLNKIFVDVKLDEDETNKILETIKEFK